MKHAKIQLIVFLFLTSMGIWGQEEILPGPDCITEKDNPSLKALKTMKDDDVLKQTFYGTLEENMNLGRWSWGLPWATSHLRLKGKELTDFLKSKPKEKNKKAFRDWTKKSCDNIPYYAKHYGLKEGRAFCTDTNRGVGEILLSYINIMFEEKKNDSFYILPGKQNNKNGFLERNRPKDITIYYLIPSSVGPIQGGELSFSNPWLYQKQKVTLKDTVGYQKIQIPNFGDIFEDTPVSGSMFKKVMIAIEINSVWDGSKEKDITCITDIQSGGGDEKEYQYIPK
ncbi:NADase-type glycan-binding domain-containing protein [Leptospira interrogans]|uniref:NADase-type glycan-binding domain-containing protein n=2 Tax=Leptospira interrogans TaxID=173 RepID=UPI003EB72EF1